MWGAGLPAMYYGNLCNFKLRHQQSVRLLASSCENLTSGQTTATALGFTYLTLNPYFASPPFRYWRAGFYSGFGLSSIVFVATVSTLTGGSSKRPACP